LEFEILGACFGHGGRFAFVCPLREDAVAQLSNFLDRSGFSFMGGAALSDQLINHISDL
jgi:hypothetical protein